MNLDYWRNNHVADKLVSWIEGFEGCLMCPDQDALNVVLEGKVKFLDYRYNFQQGFYGSCIFPVGCIMQYCVTASICRNNCT